MVLKTIKNLFCRHEYTNKITVSGYGYTEYEIQFCKKCKKVFGKQTKNYD